MIRSVMVHNVLTFYWCLEFKYSTRRGKSVVEKWIFRAACENRGDVLFLLLPFLPMNFLLKKLKCNRTQDIAKKLLADTRSCDQNRCLKLPDVYGAGE